MTASVAVTSSVSIIGSGKTAGLLDSTGLEPGFLILDGLVCTTALSVLISILSSSSFKIGFLGAGTLWATSDCAGFVLPTKGRLNLGFFLIDICSASVVS